LQKKFQSLRHYNHSETGEIDRLDREKNDTRIETKKHQQQKK